MKNSATRRMSVKRWLLVGIDLGLCAAAGAIAAAVLGSPQAARGEGFLAIVAGATLTGGAALFSVGLHRVVTSQMVGRDIWRFLAAASIAGIAQFAFIAAFAPIRAAAHVAVVFAAAMFGFVVAVHFAGRIMLRYSARRGSSRANVIVYGAGQAGLQLVAALENSADHAPVAFVDDNPGLHGRVSRALSIHDPRELPELISNLNVTQVLLAIPSASSARRREILAALEPLPVKVASVPGLAEIASGRARLSDLRHIGIEELLERDIIPPDAQLLRRCIAGKTVMVTGAGGSIGSELCRQILQQDPLRLVLYEASEVALYTIFEELNRQNVRLDAELLAVIGSTLDRARLERTCKSFGVETIYHAAAYKHVTLVEQNVTEGARNNVVSTWNVCDVAIGCGVAAMTLISTDKAVRPTSVMGATKRFAEMIVQAHALQSSRPADRAVTRFAIVRFGNVLGSSGSVVPKFRAQIAEGGPVTVTHADVVRYFMTIPEASQLVIQASAMAESGDLFVLDMGKPVRIYDLARRMIHLSGYAVRDAGNPSGDIAIEITGLKPGEKLYEELLVAANAQPTAHPGIWRAREPSPAAEVTQQAYGRLEAAIDSGDARGVIDVLEDIVGEFTPAPQFVDIVGRAPGVQIDNKT